MKYKSRAAQLYRDKLHGEAAKAMRVHGTKLFISAPQNKDDDNEDDFAKKEDEADFFEQHSNAEDNSANFEASQSVSLAKSVAAVSFFTNSPNFVLVLFEFLHTDLTNIYRKFRENDFRIKIVLNI